MKDALKRARSIYSEMESWDYNQWRARYDKQSSTGITLEILKDDKLVGRAQRLE